jgi:response regulator RpfG family c-di-GMP phosphodiesterase
VRLFRKLWYLQHLNLMQDCTQAELLTVARMTDLRTLERHDQVLRIGELTAHIYALLDGRVLCWMDVSSSISEAALAGR